MTDRRKVKITKDQQEEGCWTPANETARLFSQLIGEKFYIYDLKLMEKLGFEIIEVGENNGIN